MDDCISNCTVNENLTLHTDVSDKTSLLVMKMIKLVIGLIGVTGNCLVIFVLLRCAWMRTNLTNKLIANQSCIDFSASLCLLLSTFVLKIPAPDSNAILRDIICRVWVTNLPMWSLFCSSTYNLLSLTLERYSALAHPLKHKVYFTNKRANIIIASTWLFGFVYHCAYKIPTSGLQNGSCGVYTTWPTPKWKNIAGILAVVFHFMIPVAVILFAYTRILMILHRQSETIAASRTSGAETMTKAKRNVIKTLAVTSVCFILCWICNQIYFSLYNFGARVKLNGIFYNFTVIMVLSNCCLNPLIYTFQYRQFQKGIREAFCRDNNIQGIVREESSKSTSNMSVSSIRTRRVKASDGINCDSNDESTSSMAVPCTTESRPAIGSSYDGGSEYASKPSGIIATQI